MWREENPGTDPKCVEEWAAGAELIQSYCLHVLCIKVSIRERQKKKS
jgi:hypothetical protein